MISFQTEFWRDAEAEILACGPRHWAEITADLDIPLDVDTDTFRWLEDVGQLHVTTVRDAGTLIGYSVVIVRTHLHYKTLLCGYFDLYWLEPKARLGFAWIGLKMFREVERALKARGVQKMFAGTKVAHDASVTFARLGWTEIERLWLKRLGED